MDSPSSTALWGSSDSNYSADNSRPSFNQLVTSSPAAARVVSIVTSLLTSLVSTTTEATVGTTGNLLAFRDQRGSELSQSHQASTPTLLSTAESNSVLQGITVAAQALVLLSIFLLSSFGNSAVVIVIIKHRQLRTVTNAFIMSLSLSDFLTAVLCLPFSFVMLFSKDGIWMFGDHFCVANGFFNTCFGIISTLTMTLISFDRYYAIVRQPQAKIGRQKATRLLIAVWLTAVIFSLPWYLLVRTPTEIHKRGFYHSMGDYKFNPAMDTVAIWLAWANGAINPLIYALRNPNISMLMGRSREEGYRTRNIAAYLSSQTQNREIRLNQGERIRDHYVSRVGVNNNSRLSSSSPGKGGEVAMWACKNPAVFFCRDAQPDTATLPNSVSTQNMKTVDTSL
ncbi:hypothetical protein F2P81_003928 [Scophthalmus maximus]|uniref:G-protein coupled receptors family 1 profile domain-containing protein n=1 Tax=Scophthalmus maximus TaxID=52904 RepID=A0A6A4TMB3_SCOMX|nr:hypothetical protein F2P81_003928 [Scophthalmus maximus]